MFEGTLKFPLKLLPVIADKIKKKKVRLYKLYSNNVYESNIVIGTLI